MQCISKTENVRRKKKRRPNFRFKKNMLLKPNETKCQQNIEYTI